MTRMKKVLLIIVTAVVIHVGNISTIQAADKSVKPQLEWSGRLPKKEDERLIKEAPKSGYIAGEKTWAMLWKAWRGNEELPKVEFEKQLVLVGTVEGATNDIGSEFKLSDEGDLKGGFPVSNIRGPGFAYKIVLIDRMGIKTYNGKSIEKE